MQAHTYPYETVQPSTLDKAYRSSGRVPPCAGHAFSDQPDIDFGMNKYQEQTNKTAIYPPENALQYLSTGLAAEVGEFCGKVAKCYRGDQGIDVIGATAELGDILWFVAQLSQHLGYDLADVATANLHKLRSRAERGKLQGNGDNR